MEDSQVQCSRQSLMVNCVSSDGLRYKRPLACHAKDRCCVNAFVTFRNRDVIGDIAYFFSKSTTKHR